MLFLLKIKRIRERRAPTDSRAELIKTLKSKLNRETRTQFLLKTCVKTKTKMNGFQYYVDMVKVTA